MACISNIGFEGESYGLKDAELRQAVGDIGAVLDEILESEDPLLAAALDEINGEVV